MEIDINSLSDHDKAMIEAANKGGARFEVSDALTGVKVTHDPIKLDGTNTADSAKDKDKNVEPAKPGGEPKPPEPQKAQKPADVPDKYWDPEKGEVRYAEWAKSTLELERKLHERAKEPPKVPEKTAAQKAAEEKLAAATTDEEKAAAQAELEAANKAAQEAAKKAAEEAERNAKPDVAELRRRATEELTNYGKLSEQSYAEAAKLGWDRETVDQYIEGQRAKAELIQMKMFEAAGGKDTYTKMIAWAKTNLSAEEQAAFDASLDNENLDVPLGSIKGLASRYLAAVGSSGKLVEPEGDDGAASGDIFKSDQELVEAMRDPRYHTDAAYREEVMKKIARGLRRN